MKYILPVAVTGVIEVSETKPASVKYDNSSTIYESVTSPTFVVAAIDSLILSYRSGPNTSSE